TETHIPVEAKTNDFRIVNIPKSEKAEEPTETTAPPDTVAAKTEPTPPPAAEPPAPAPAAETKPAESKPVEKPAEKPTLAMDESLAMNELEAENVAPAAQPDVEQAPKGEGGTGQFVIQLVAYSRDKQKLAEGYVAEL